ncbi:MULTISPECIES: bacteriocin immunity protein [Enterococcus]|uniref:Enterocin A immunity protein n=1 Tax=Enterococcus sulfureus ATCC 49903 TaxID=1140003 RepID=S0NX67_9ENTE|nr:bacteriocin immunity protein [Enterococcus sulfureus]EOT46500.1 hypothetical protein OMY_01649 [Enterococcus sulfureus ATCC 49903]EOT86187.1 hypothetical protein I573_00940 [Enterococcus sulfureus ATCC 49903]
MKKVNDQEMLLATIDVLLSQEIRNEERTILQQARNELDTSAYIPRVLNGLRSELTPLAIGGKLSKHVGEFYMEINNSKFMPKNLGGMISVWSSIFR